MPEDLTFEERANLDFDACFYPVGEVIVHADLLRDSFEDEGYVDTVEAFDED